MRSVDTSGWRCLSRIWRSFWVVSWSSTKHGSPGTHQRPGYIRNSALYLWISCEDREDCPIVQKGYGHRKFLEFIKYTSTTCRTAKWSRVYTMPNYWSDSTPNCRKTFSNWQRTYPPAHTSVVVVASAKHVELRTTCPSSEFSRLEKSKTYFADLQEAHFSDGLKKSDHHWAKCSELKGDSLWNESEFFHIFWFSFVGYFVFIGPTLYRQLYAHMEAPKYV